MHRLARLAFSAILLCAAAPLAAQGTRDFVRVRGTNLVVGDRPYHFVGVNLWFAMNLGAEGAGADRARLGRELDRLKAMGVDNVRLMASSEGPATEPSRVVPPAQPAPGQYDERVLHGLDLALAELAKRDMRAVLILNNFFQWTGGMAQYVSWATGEPIPYPERNGKSWDDFQQFSARFYATPKAQELFERYVLAVTGRKNTVTGVAYRDDPTIMAWQLSNEPRGFAHAEDYVRWVDRAGAFLHAHAPRQLVSLGGEGKLDRNTPGTRTQFERVSRSRQLDYLTVHVWIENWGWYKPAHADTTFDRALGRTLSYVADHVAIARAVGKPIVFEEFGVSRDSGRFEPGAPVTLRDRWFTTVLEGLWYLASETPDSPVAGANVWSWSGEARPREPGAMWRLGDPFTGDPPHERQGWYSIYDTDRSTIAIITRYAGLMKAIGGEEQSRKGR